MTRGSLFDKAYMYIERHSMLKMSYGVVLGLSGGADSTALLLLLCTLRQSYGLKLYAVHLNHCFRGEDADKDAEFCAMLCEKFGTEYICFKEDIGEVARRLRITQEEAGRKRRYELFEQVRREKNADVIAVAHNKNDNAETVLHRLFRGTGIKGAAGIPSKRGAIIRPLLSCGREEIEEYLAENGQEYRVDETNYQNKYTRNKIRNTILPILQNELNPNVIDALDRFSLLCSKQESFLRRLCEKAFSDCTASRADGIMGITIDLEKLEQYDDFLKESVLRMAVESAAGLKDITSTHIEAISRLVAGMTGKNCALPHGLTARKSYGRLIIERKTAAKEIYGKCEPGKAVRLNDSGLMLLLSLNNDKEPENLLYTNVFDYAKITEDIVVRTRANGDVFTKKLKSWLIDKKIDRAERGRMPLLCCGKNVLAILDEGLGCPANKKFAAGSETKEKLYTYIFQGGADEEA